MSSDGLRADGQQHCSAERTNNAPVRVPSGNLYGRLYTVSEIAEQLKISPDTVIRLFKDEKGVIDFGTAATRTRRRYHILRIPEAIVRRVIDRRRVQ